MTIDEAAHALGVPVESIERWIREGKLTAVKLEGGERQLAKRQVEAILGMGFADGKWFQPAITSGGAGRQLGVTSQALRNWIDRGILVCSKTLGGGQLRFSMAQIELAREKMRLKGRPRSETQAADGNQAPADAAAQDEKARAWVRAMLARRMLNKRGR
jgi:excisionase family DNA binding protein